MAYELQDQLVIGIASSALFDLTESDAVFRQQGEQNYREFQEAHLDDALNPGVAFPFVRRLLSLNDLGGADGERLVEVIVLSRNDPDTGLRVMRSIAHHGLDISRAIFMQGKSPYRFIPAMHMSLFLSANEADVMEAVKLGLPAGRVLESTTFADAADDDLRIAFDFDGVLADDTSEQIYQSGGLQTFQDHEVANAVTPHHPGPLRDFLAKINVIQRREEVRRRHDETYKIRLHVSIVTARNAPAHERAVESLKEWGVTVNDAFFLGGFPKGPIIQTLRPHIFFDDQLLHLESAAQFAPSVHIPFGTQTAQTDEPPPPE